MRAMNMYAFSYFWTILLFEAEASELSEFFFVMQFPLCWNIVRCESLWIPGHVWAHSATKLTWITVQNNNKFDSKKKKKKTIY